MHEIMGWLMVVGSRDALLEDLWGREFEKINFMGLYSYLSIHIDPARDRSSPKPPEFGSYIRCMKYDVCTVLKSPVEIPTQPLGHFGPPDPKKTPNPWRAGWLMYGQEQDGPDGASSELGLCTLPACTYQADQTHSLFPFTRESRNPKKKGRKKERKVNATPSRHLYSPIRPSRKSHPFPPQSPDVWFRLTTLPKVAGAGQNKWATFIKPL